MGSSRADRPVVAVCIGKDCRQSDAHADVLSSLEEVGDVETVKCLGICSGPVVVVRPDDAAVVLSKVRSRKQRRQLVEAVADEAPLKRTLAEQEVTGAKRVKALRRLAKGRG